MATNFLSTANPFCLPSSSSFSPSLSLATPAYVYQPMKCSVKRQLTLCKAVNEAELCPPSLTKRGISISIVTSFVLSFAGKGCLDANAAILEAEDDEELMEKVKKDRKKRLERQGVINSSTKETGASKSWDPGGNYYVGCNCESLQFKQWDPGIKFSRVDLHLEDKVLKREGVLIRSGPSHVCIGRIKIMWAQPLLTQQISFNRMAWEGRLRWLNSKEGEE
ncbi:uncharacterized protein LOC133295907 isoform X2 [Gastrolobium bilobum]|uniref:uncharacterized protein LOC133295907 isoform X2 n=1 Tax=Gastrolobium bilobum TaxID=150636 RepID=UPI002AB1A53C|nr:uncharacterized protein LOC133295907 isoform X2 [Gastrolobium bilobum]